jgi:hypothetical protein
LVKRPYANSSTPKVGQILFRNALSPTKLNLAKSLMSIHSVHALHHSKTLFRSARVHQSIRGNPTTKLAILDSTKDPNNINTLITQ